LKPTQANSSQDSVSKKTIIKKGRWSGSRCRPGVKPQYCKKKKTTYKKKVLAEQLKW
jgi:hypothetical protein